MATVIAITFGSIVSLLLFCSLPVFLKGVEILN